MSSLTQTKKPLNLMTDIPAELRLKIGGYLLICQDDIKIADGRKMQRKAGEDNPNCAILLTCKELNTELTPVLYGRNSFSVSIRKPLPLPCPSRSSDRKDAETGP